MQSHRRSVMVIGLLMCTMICGRQQCGAEYAPESLGDLSMIECIYLLNQDTNTIVNLERLLDDRRTNYYVNLIQLKRDGAQAVVQSLISQNTNYAVLRDGRTINILPREELNNPKYLFNRVSASFTLDQENIVGFMHHLFSDYPEEVLELMHPFTLAKTLLQPQHDLDKAGKRVSMTLTNANLRTILNRFVELQDGMYWLAFPNSESRYQVKGEWRTVPAGVTLRFHSLSEKMGPSVIRDRDPEWRAWIKYGQETPIPPPGTPR